METPTLFYQYFKTSYGELILGDYLGKLVLCDWRYRKMRSAIDKRLRAKITAVWLEKTSPLIEQTQQELTEYFEQKRKSFEIPLHLVGTDFQQKVWQTLITIPFGQTRSYLQLSEQLGDKNAIRAVAAANGANGISIIIPCHRVIGSNGKLVGYAGGISAKRKLLELENSTLLNTNPQQMVLDF